MNGERGTCPTCDTIGRPADKVTFNECCHRYFKGDKELVSVSKILRSVWPIKPDFSQAPEDVLENARQRGCAVDGLFTAYVNGNLSEIPVGTRQDAAELFLKVKAWFDGKHDKATAQVILADDQVAGQCDLWADDECIYDLKTTYNIEPMYHLQLGAYAQLHFATFGKPVKKLAIIHVTKRLRKPAIIPIDISTALPDWMLLRDTWFMAQRRAAHEK